MQRILVRALVLTVVLALVGALGWMIYDRVSSASEGTDGPGRGSSVAVAVEVQPVRVEPIRDVRTFTGTLRARAQYTVAPRIAGRLERLVVDIGDTVERDQVVAWLDDEEHVQQVNEAEAELEVAKANAEEARDALDIAFREYERNEQLRQQRIVSESQLDAARADYQAKAARVRVAEAQMEQQQAALRAANVRRSYTRIRAAWDEGSGPRIVGERFVDEGDMLSANEPVITVLDVESLVAVVHVNERDYARLAVGQSAQLTAAPHPTETFEGVVRRMAPLFRETSRQARIELEVPNSERKLQPGMFVQVRLELGQEEDAVVVPRVSLARRDGQQGVFLADPETARVTFVPVSLGITTRERVQVISPPLEGLVVTLGQHLLTDGSDIVIVDDEPEAAVTEAVGQVTP